MFAVRVLGFNDWALLHDSDAVKCAKAEFIIRKATKV
jgi:hypothetical protein